MLEGILVGIIDASLLRKAMQSCSGVDTWSQNLGHENCLTTFSSYGAIPPSRQAEIIRGLAAPAPPRETPPEVLRWLESQMKLKRA